MTFDDLRKTAASLQHTEGSRQRLQAQAINELYQRCIESDKVNINKLSNEIIISKAAEELYADEKMYMSALNKISTINKSLMDNSLSKCATLVKYISKKYDFDETMIKTEQYFNEKETYEDFLLEIKKKAFYLYISDDTLHDVYEMLVAKSLV